ncbi:MAG: hypothetical protein JJLCMIEE_00053 [Acidimicrobiales bacterium]|nr:MAG: HlyC/CorC family transporter [Actinomycetota bacterium]MBV6507016.1 hypothetical protein [Acidimicrobiales bacterium]RIK05825.1 MAG: hypothetical protein DCC48_09165 [Acidobacteriota bacterium]
MIPGHAVLASSAQGFSGWALAAAAVLLLANAFFVAVEFAVVAARRTRIEPLADQGDRRARAALRSLTDLNVQLAGAQLGITMASLGLGFVAEPAVGSLVESAVGRFWDLPETALRTISFVLALTIVVYLHMVVGEMVPKNLAIANPERSLLRLALPNRIYLFVFGPVVRVLTVLGNAGVRALGIEPADELRSAHTTAELAYMVEESHEKGLIAAGERKLLSSALGFGARTAGSAMVPRQEIVAVSRTATVAATEDLIRQSGHSRILVTDDGIEHVLGFVHAKDLLGLPDDAKDLPLPSAVLRLMLSVSPERPLAEVLVAMRTSRRHLALVVDSTGTTAGLLSLEDILERLVGDIVDEYDRRTAAGP